MISTVKVKYQGAVPSDAQLGKREYNNLRKESWFTTGKYWFQHFREKHFTKAGAQEYGYKRRKGELIAKSSPRYKRSYTGRKEAQFGHTDPLVFTGESKRASRQSNIRSTNSGVRVSLPGLRKFNFRHPRSQINMAEEMRTISEVEKLRLIQVHDQDTDQRLNSFRKVTTITHKG